MSYASAPDAALLDLIYGAAIDPAAWGDVLHTVTERAGGDGAALIWQDLFTNAPQGVYSRMDPEALRLFSGHFATRNPLRPSAAAVRKMIPNWTPRVILDEHRMAKDEFVKTEFYNDFLRRFGFHSTAAIGLTVESSGMAGTFDILRSPAKGRFTQEELAFCGAVQPHLIRAFKLSRRLAAERGVGEAMSLREGRSKVAMFVLSPSAKLLRLNGEASRLAADGGVLRVSNGILMATHVNAQRRFETLVARAGDSDWENRAGGTMTLPATNRLLPLPVSVTPVRTRDHPVFVAPAVLVCVTDLEERAHLTTERLRDVFGLSAAEARVALCLFEGQPTDLVAKSLGITVNTVRNHRARILEKTHTSTQAELARRMTRLAESEG